MKINKLYNRVSFCLKRNCAYAYIPYMTNRRMCGGSSCHTAFDCRHKIFQKERMKKLATENYLCFEIIRSERNVLIMYGLSHRGWQRTLTQVPCTDVITNMWEKWVSCSRRDIQLSQSVLDSCAVYSLAMSLISHVNKFNRPTCQVRANSRWCNASITLKENKIFSTYI